MSDNGRDPKGGGAAAGVGYGRPPKSRQFIKGQSGNPAGKRKGTKNRPRSLDERLNALMLVEAYRPVRRRVDGVEVTMPLAQAVLRSLGDAALKGEARARVLFFKMIGASEAEEAVMEELIAEAGEPEPDIKTIEFRIVDPKGNATGQIVYPDYGAREVKDGKDK